MAPFVLGLTIYGLETGLFFASLERIDVSLASLLMCSYPALVVAGAVLRRERASRRRAAALVVALGGVALVLAGGVGGASIRSGSACPFARRLRPTCSSRIGCSARPAARAGDHALRRRRVAFSLGGAATSSLEPGRPSALLVVGAIALVATVLPIAAFLGGVDRIGPSRATILGTIEPPLTIALSAAVFGERLGPLQLLGAVLVVSGVVILQLRRMRSSVRCRNRRRGRSQIQFRTPSE